MSVELKEPKIKWERDLAAVVADGLLEWLAPYCEPGFLQAAGSLRRGKLLVGDVEILYVPRTGPVRKRDEMFESTGNLADMAIETMLEEGKLAKRPNVDGGFAWGTWNKLAIHKATGLPVDLFATKPENWWVSLVIRTGPKELNIALCEGARKRGLHLRPYGAFTDLGTGQPIYPESEQEVFELCGVRYREAEERE